jgi:hypothetical protein
MGRQIWVRLPFAGYVDIPVEVDDPSEALDAAYEATPDLRLPDTDEWKHADWSYDWHEHIVLGNVCYVDEPHVSFYDEDGEIEVW